MVTGVKSPSRVITLLIPGRSPTLFFGFCKSHLLGSTEKGSRDELYMIVSVSHPPFKRNNQPLATSGDFFATAPARKFACCNCFLLWDGCHLKWWLQFCCGCGGCVVEPAQIWKVFHTKIRVHMSHVNLHFTMNECGHCRFKEENTNGSNYGHPGC